MCYERDYIDPPVEWFDSDEYVEIHRCDGCGQRESAFFNYSF